MRVGVGVDIGGKPKPFTASGTDQIFASAATATFFGTTTADPRVPDVDATTQPGTVSTSGTKIAKHGGIAAADRNVPLIVAGPGITHRHERSRGQHRPDRTDDPVSARPRPSDAARRGD